MKHQLCSFQRSDVEGSASTLSPEEFAREWLLLLLLLLTDLLGKFHWETTDLSCGGDIFTEDSSWDKVYLWVLKKIASESLTNWDSLIDKSYESSYCNSISGIYSSIFQFISNHLRRIYFFRCIEVVWRIQGYGQEQQGNSSNRKKKVTDILIQDVAEYDPKLMHSVNESAAWHGLGISQIVKFVTAHQNIVVPTTRNLCWHIKNCICSPK